MLVQDIQGAGWINEIEKICLAPDHRMANAKYVEVFGVLQYLGATGQGLSSLLFPWIPGGHGHVGLNNWVPECNDERECTQIAVFLVET
jgi:hypothetical protein